MVLHSSRNYCLLESGQSLGEDYRKVEGYNMFNIKF